MIDTPLIRAARALALAQSGVDDFDALDAGLQAMLVENVRAVLLAVREPTEHMTSAGTEIVQNVHAEESDIAFRSDAANVWRFMIDAALGER